MKKALSLLAVTCSICVQSYAVSGGAPYHQKIKPAKTPEVHASAPKPAAKESEQNKGKQTDGNKNAKPAENPLEGK